MSCPPPPSLSVSDSYNYVAINLQGVLLGILLVLYYNTMHALVIRRPHRTSDVFYAIFSTGMLLMAIFFVATSAYFAQTIWLLNPGYPGGPDAYSLAHIREWYNLLGAVSTVVLQLMTDALLMYRVRLVWDNYRIIIVPFFLWLTTLALGIVICWVGYFPGHYVSIEPELRFALAYYSIAVLLNVTLTALICARVLLHARRVRKHIGAEYTSPYFSIVIIFVESALPYTICGIMYVISLGIGSPVAFVFLRFYTLMTAISPQMLILRVARGIAWSGDSVKQPPGSMMKFSSSTQYPTFGERKADASDIAKSVSA